MKRSARSIERKEGEPHCGHALLGGEAAKAFVGNKHKNPLEHNSRE